MAIDTVLVTGGSGTVGRAALTELNDHGYHTVNCNRGKPRGGPENEYRTTDLTSPSDVYGSFAAVEPDAVVHLGMIPTPDNHPEHTVYESNAMSSYYVLEAAQVLDVESVVLASSLSTIGAGFESDPLDPEYLPIDEAHPLEPSNPYGMGKQTLELIADGFGRRDRQPRTITSLRFPWVTDDEAQWETFVEADRRLQGIEASGRIHADHNTLFTYIDQNDASRAIRLAVEADFEGHEPFFLSAPDTSCENPTAEAVDRRYPDAVVRTDLEEYEALIDTTKAAELLGWKPQHSWREL